jgi:hypothetical protein
MTHATTHHDTERLRRAHERDPATVRLLRAFSGASGLCAGCPHRACRRAKSCAWRFPSCYARDEAAFRALLLPFLAVFGFGGARPPAGEEAAERLSAELDAGLQVLHAARLDGLFEAGRFAGDCAALAAFLRDLHSVARESAARSGMVDAP